MEDVGFAIDIAWFDGDGTLVSTAEMVPCDGAVPAVPRGGALPLGGRGAGRRVHGPRAGDRLVVGD